MNFDLGIMINLLDVKNIEVKTGNFILVFCIKSY